jgi:UDP-N-acetyl-2-amino-2-deoxyglucuronate dehydrogenase
MLDRERLDLVSVATPDDHHAAPVTDAIARGVKGILCEKPLATTLADADRIVDAVERSGTPTVIDHTRCCEPHYVEARQRLREGYVGDLARIVAYTGGKRAMLFRNTTHQLAAV